jgi:cyanophycinase
MTRSGVWLVGTFLAAELFAGVQAFAQNVPTEAQLLPTDGIRGSLVICGGGRLPDAIRDRFIELAGGKGARLVVIPTASEDADLARDGAEIVELWMARNPKEVQLLHTRSRDDANRPEFTEPLRQATAVWISGGRQSLLAAAYSGTAVEKELHALLRRGGVVGGTSAGAAIMSRQMIVKGIVHDVPGLGLLPGAVIDQHGPRRKRDRLEVGGRC